MLFQNFQIITEKSSNTTIHLLMQGARATDSGIYKCQPNNAPEAQIKVHILIGGKLFKAGETNFLISDSLSFEIKVFLLPKHPYLCNQIFHM